MISIIVSTYRPEFYKKLEESIIRTIGVPFEMIPIENHGEYSIAQAYNLGIKKAQYSHLCFVHEDVVFQAVEWGSRAIQIMQTQGTGMVGVVGCTIQSKNFIGWCNTYKKNILLRGRIDQGLNSWTKHRYTDLFKTDQDISEVVSIDGVFMFTKKDIAEEYPFDEKIIRGFHGYDLDFSLQLKSKKYKIFIDRGILLYHYSDGDANKVWLSTNLAVLKKWRNILPQIASDFTVTSSEMFKIDIYSLLRKLRAEINVMVFKR
jgi:GT2 family glycosyltransferase